jgi:hypothetical protein
MPLYFPQGKLDAAFHMDICIVWHTPVMSAVMAGVISTLPLLHHLSPFGDFSAVWEGILCTGVGLPSDRRALLFQQCVKPWQRASSVLTEQCWPVSWPGGFNALQYPDDTVSGKERDSLLGSPSHVLVALLPVGVLHVALWYARCHAPARVRTFVHLGRKWYWLFLIHIIVFQRPVSLMYHFAHPLAS